jgi:hypothetical protein
VVRHIYGGTIRVLLLDALERQFEHADDGNDRLNWYKIRIRLHVPDFKGFCPSGACMGRECAGGFRFCVKCAESEN